MGSARRKSSKRSKQTDRHGSTIRSGDLVVLLLGVAFVVALNLTPIYTSDFWLQLKVGDIIRETGAIPHTILFACTEAAGYEFVAHEWLSSLLSSYMFSVVGYGGMIVFKCGIALVIFGLVLLLSWRINRNVPVSVFVGCLVLLAINFRTHMRPELFAFVFALVTLNLIRRFLETEKPAWLAATVAVGLVWANSHGSFLVNVVLPLVILAGTVADDWRSGSLRDPAARAGRMRRIYLPLAIAALSILVVSLINPNGLKLVRHSLQMSQADFLREHIVEFGATFDPRVLALSYTKIYFVVLAIVVASFLIAWRRTSLLCVVLFLAFGFLSIEAIRYTAWFAIASSWILAWNLGGSARSGPNRTVLVLALVAGLLGATAIVVQQGNVRGRTIGFEDGSPLSPAAIDYIAAAGIRGNVFNSYNYGDQLVYNFYPKIKVAIDSRNDAYGERYYLDYRSMSGRSLRLLGPAHDLIDFLDRNAIGTIVTRPYDYRNWTLRDHATRLQREGWTISYTDETTVILQRHVFGGV